MQSEQTILELEFVPTRQEREEAWSLSLRRQVAFGSKWGTLIVLILFLLGLLAFFGWMIWRGVPAAYRGYVVAGFAALWIFAFVYQRRMQRNAEPATARMRISREGLEIQGPQGGIRLTWQGISRHFESDTIFALVDRSKQLLYVVPKRAFPDGESIEWFGALLKEVDTQAAADAAAGQPIQAFPPEAPVAAPQPGQILVEPDYRFRDYLEYALSSWEARAFAIGGVLFVVITFTIVAMQPPSPRAVHSLAFVALMMLPFNAVFVVVGPSMLTFSTWKKRRLNEPSRIVIDEDGLVLHKDDGAVSVRWGAYRYYRQTKNLMLIWSNWRGGAIIIPKRSFASPSDLERATQIACDRLRPGRLVKT